MFKKEIVDDAVKHIFKLKLEQLNEVRDSFTFNHPLAKETIWLFNHKFDVMYEDEKMLSILDGAYVEIQTKESREKLFDGLKLWSIHKGYILNDLKN